MALKKGGRVVVRVRDQGNPIYDNLFKKTTTIIEKLPEEPELPPIPTPQIVQAIHNDSPALEAVKLVYGQRNLDYGDPFQNFKEIAEIANAIKDRNDTNTYEPYGVATVLCALKLARIKHNPGPDSFADLCGYTDIKGRMAKAELHKPKTES